MKILLLTNSLHPHSGWGRCAADLVLGIRKAGHEVMVLKEEDDGHEGLPILKRGMKLFWSAYLVRKYVQQCDVIHALDGYPNGIIAALANAGINKKLIITAIGTYSIAPLYRWKTSWLLAWAYRRSSHITCISRFTMSQLVSRVNLPNASVVNLGIDYHAFYGEHEISGETFMLSVGALKYRKGYHISLSAFGMIKKRFPALKYKIVGSTRDAQCVDSLLSLAREQGTHHDIELLGEISDDDIRKLYRQASVFVLTSVNQGHHFEGYGLVCLEAAAAGLPVIGTKGNGIEDAVQDGYNGILVDQNDIVSTAKAMTDILSDEKMWSTMSVNSQKWASAHDRDIMVRHYLDLYTTQ